MSTTRVKKKGEKTVVYMDGQQLQGSGSNIMISCGPGASQSRGTVYQMPNSGYDGTAGMVSCMGSPGSSCRTTVSLENMNDQPQILRVVPRGTTILLEEVKPPPKAQKSGSAASGRSSKYGAARRGSPTIQVVQECGSSAGYYPPAPPPAAEPGPAEHCIECLEELIKRRRSERRHDREGQAEMRVTARIVDESKIPGHRGGGCCPTCGNPMSAQERD
ncbi:uncharacterized protein LOC119433093 [Dermacentor silvarum]|uniref:uncharacterized protein LOC119433093 n=1 Tax=Dermacentor silvarum TaxID=543639 RepID=UPI00189C2124|nr:uncharacterized protein LOC119433093 [Dermacentor silvarum]